MEHTRKFRRSMFPSSKGRTTSPQKRSYRVLNARLGMPSRIRFRLAAIRVVTVVFVFVSEMSQSHIVAPMEAFTVFFTTFRWNRRFTKFPFPLHIRGTLIRDIPASGFDTVVEAPALYIPEFRRRRIPLTATLIGWRALLHHRLYAHHFLGVSKGYVVAAAKTLPVFIAEPLVHSGMAKFLVHFGVGGTTILHIFACGFNSIMEAAPLHVAKFLWRSVPSATSLIRAVLRRRVLGGEVCRCSQRKGERCESDSRELH